MTTGQLRSISINKLKLNQICENSEVERSEKLVLVLENDDKEACWTSPLDSEDIF